MTNKRQNITKFILTAFLLLQFVVCFADNVTFSTDNSIKGTIFVYENTAISGFENIFTENNNASTSIENLKKVEKTKIYICNNSKISGIENIFGIDHPQPETKNNYINMLSVAEQIATEEQNKNKRHTAIQNHRYYTAQSPFNFFAAGENSVAILPASNHKRYKSHNTNFNALSKLLNCKNNNFINNYAICLNAVFGVKMQCGILTSFASNSPPH
jgi:hypothetical protein